MMRSIASDRSVHYLLLGAVLFELFELEAFSIGAAHHCWDAVAIAIYASAASRISGQRSSAWILVFLAGVPWTMDLLGLQVDSFDVESFFWMLTHLFLLLTVGHLLYRADTITDIEVVDAVTLYLMAGVAFANLYSLILWHHPGALIHAGTPAGERISYDLVLYYSFITQATVGYGDMAPAHQMTRTVSVVQSLFGVMYIAILISRLVSIHSANYLSRRAPEDERRSS